MNTSLAQSQSGPTERKFVTARGELLTLLWDRRASPNLRDRLASRLGDLAEDAEGLRDVFAGYDPAGPPPPHVMVFGLPLFHRPPGSDAEAHGLECHLGRGRLRHSLKT